jgi:hypothetical protein
LYRYSTAIASATGQDIEKRRFACCLYDNFCVSGWSLLACFLFVVLFLDINGRTCA